MKIIGITVATIILPIYVAAKLEESHKVLFWLFLLGYFVGGPLLVSYCGNSQRQALISQSDTLVDSIGADDWKFENFSAEYS